eukprot:jgi/Tetstr1/429673/TSEL_019570.t1
MLRRALPAVCRLHPSPAPAARSGGAGGAAHRGGGGCWASLARRLSCRGGLGFDASLLDSVVKVFTVHSAPNCYMPWQMKAQRESSGSGFVVAPGRVLTNAHVVADGALVSVKRHGGGGRAPARVAAVGHECDLALLEVEEPGFWGARPPAPLRLGRLPALQDAVAVVGFPAGGDNLSVTRGVVSRVDLTQYAHGAASLMALQIDAAINPGNSGGPALGPDGALAGVAFQNLRGAEGIGYVVPPPVVAHFLTASAAAAAAERPYAGFPSLGVRCQPTENPQLRAALGLPPGGGGVLVSAVRPCGSAAGVLAPGDVLLELDGAPVGADGSVALRGRERISFDHLVAMRHIGEALPLRVLRAPPGGGDPQPLRLRVPLAPAEPLVPVHMHDAAPSYLVAGGLVFTPLSQPYLHEYGEDWYNAAPRRLVETALRGQRRWAGQQVVLLSQVLADPLNLGYQGLAELPVAAVDGVRVLNMRHLKARLDVGLSRRGGAPVRLHLADDRLLALDPEAVAAAGPRVLARHRIPAPHSADLGPPPTAEEAAHWAAFEAAEAATAGDHALGWLRELERLAREQEELKAAFERESEGKKAKAAAEADEMRRLAEEAYVKAKAKQPARRASSAGDRHSRPPSARMDSPAQPPPYMQDDGGPPYPPPEAHAYHGPPGDGRHPPHSPPYPPPPEAHHAAYHGPPPGMRGQPPREDHRYYDAHRPPTGGSGRTATEMARLREEIAAQQAEMKRAVERQMHGLTKQQEREIDDLRRRAEAAEAEMAEMRRSFYQQQAPFPSGPPYGRRASAGRRQWGDESSGGGFDMELPQHVPTVAAPASAAGYAASPQLQQLRDSGDSVDLDASLAGDSRLIFPGGPPSRGGPAPGGSIRDLSISSLKPLPSKPAAAPQKPGAGAPPGRASGVARPRSRLGTPVDVDGVLAKAQDRTRMLDVLQENAAAGRGANSDALDDLLIKFVELEQAGEAAVNKSDMSISMAGDSEWIR